LGSLTKQWHIEFLSQLDAVEIKYDLNFDTCYTLVLLKECRVSINLMDLADTFDKRDLVDLQDAEELKQIQLIQLWEDIWSTRREQVLSRIISIVGLNKKIYGRNTSVLNLTQQEADVFLNQNHLQCSVGAKYRYGLVKDGTLVAVACFSRLRKMNNGIANYNSAELIRFANIQGATVIGGFTKLLSYFIKEHEPNDIMSYADRDWSRGSAYVKSGFKLVGKTPPATVLVNKQTMQRIFPHRLGIDVQITDYLKVFNLGNLKYIFSCEY
jgi:hypothetical protein